MSSNKEINDYIEYVNMKADEYTREAVEAEANGFEYVVDYDEVRRNADRSIDNLERQLIYLENEAKDLLSLIVQTRRHARMINVAVKEVNDVRKTDVS